MSLPGALLLILALQDPSSDPVKILERMKSPKEAERREALEALRKCGGKAVPEALRVLKGPGPVPAERIAGLVGKLGSASWEERDASANALTKLGWRALGALAAHAKKAPDVEVAWRVKAVVAEIREGEEKEKELEGFRTAALCRFLGEAGKAEAVDPLLEHKEEGSSEIAVRLAEALGRLRGVMKGDQPERAVEKILYKLYPALREARRKCLLLKAVARLRSPVCVRPLTALLKDRSERDLQIKRNCLAVLAVAGGTSGARAIVEALGAEQVYVRQAAVEQLEVLAGEDFGFDPRDGAEANRDAIKKARAWMSKRTGEPLNR
jgi:hypothetical protein